jgi:hypothetical protein
MLTSSQKAEILQRAGYAVPAQPVEHPASQITDPTARARWQQTVEALFVEYAAARAAKSLRDSEEHRQLCHLRRMASHSSSTRAG